jgi:hypothetical protein
MSYAGGDMTPDSSYDTAPAGAGGDPFAGASPDTTTPETADLGLMPGGGDNQFSPFSPGGGFDFTNALQLGAGASRLASSFNMGGPRGLTWQGGPDAAPQPTGPNLGVMSNAQQVGAIVKYIRGSTGLRVSAKSIVGLIVRYGFQAAAAMFRVDVGSLLPVFMRAKAVRHHRRGPGLYTIAKKLRRADRLRATVRHLLGPAVSGHHHHAAPRARARRRR